MATHVNVIPKVQMSSSSGKMFCTLKIQLLKSTTWSSSNNLETKHL